MNSKEPCRISNSTGKPIGPGHRRRAGRPHARGRRVDLDLAWPWPPDLAYRNLADLWRNYTALGYSRLIYTNTNSVLDSEPLLAALGDQARAVGVLLTATDATARSRLSRREIGTALDAHVDRSTRAAVRLTAAPPWVTRVPTDDRTVPALARELATHTGWLPS